MTTHDLLLMARSALREALALHVSSYNVGRLESLAESGIADQDMEQARRSMELMFRAEAEIQRRLSDDYGRITHR